MRPYLRSANVTWSGIDLTDVKTMNFAPNDAATFRLEPGDLLLNEASGSPNEVGKPAIWNGELDACCFQNTLLRVRSKGPATSYLYWYCRSAALAGAFGEAGRGVNIRHLGKQGLAAFPIPLAPLAEQDRIVAAIEEHLSRLDAAVSDVVRVRKKLNRMRAAVLANAFALAAEQNGTAALTQVAGSKALFVDGDWVESKDQDPAGACRLTQLADVGDGNWRDRSKRFMNHEQFERLSCTALRGGDVLVARMPDPLGRACLFPGDERTCATVVDVAIIRPVAGACDSSWLMWMINSPQVRDQIAALAKGTTRRRISRRNLGTVILPNPSPQFQHRQRRELEATLDGIARLEREASGVTGRESLLSSTVFAAAFSGQLAPQDPEDEPAVLMLERIMTERVVSRRAIHRNQRNAS